MHVLERDVDLRELPAGRFDLHLEPQTIERSAGKAKRVIDKREMS